IALVGKWPGAGGLPVGVAAGRGARRRERHPPLHRVPAFAEDDIISVRLVELPGGDHDDVAPARRPVQPAEGTVEALEGCGGGDVGDKAVVALVEDDVSEPFAGEAVDVIEEGGGRDIQLPVSRPPCTLTLWAVGGDVAGVAAEAPYRCLVEARDPFVAAGEPAGTSQTGVNDHTGYVIGGELAGVALDPDVLEAVGGETRLEDVPLSARGHDPVHLSGLEPAGQDREIGCQVVGRDVPSVVKPLAVSEGDFGPRRPEVGQPDPAVDVLTKIHHLDARPRTRHRDRTDLLDPAN